MQVLDLLLAYGGRCIEALPWMVVLGLAGMLLYGADPMPTGRRRRLRAALVVGALGVGLALAWRRASLVDDAFITMRVVTQHLSGHGFVFNPGESVLGITNLGWAMILSLVARTGVSLPHAALFGCMAAYVATTAAILWASTAFRRSAPWPAATVLFALQGTAISYATTGLETSAATLGVVLGVGALLHSDDALGALGAGLAFAFAAWMRLDHGLFWLGATLVVAVRSPGRTWALVAPGGLVIAELWWCWAVYGDPLPNTFYAKSVVGWYPRQGLWYIALWWLGSHLIWLVPAVVGWMVVRTDDRREADLGAMVVVMGALWHGYLLAIGGDFMHGRFLLPILALGVLALERCTVHARLPWLMGGLLAASVGGVVLVPAGHALHHIADESTFYPLTSVRPLEVGHGSWGTGIATAALLDGMDPKPVMAAHGIGMLGYHNPDLVIVDVLGLTDRTVGQQPLQQRTRPGHEKRPPQGYLASRGVELTQQPPDAMVTDLTEVRFRHGTHRLFRTHLHHWDRDLADALRRAGADVTDADAWAEGQLWALPGQDPAHVRRVIALLDRWYFPQVDRRALQQRLHRELLGESPMVLAP